MHRFNDYEHIAAHFEDVPQYSVDMFLMKNGLPIANPNSGYKGGKGKDMWDTFDNRDPRLYQNIQPPYVVAANDGTADGVNSFKTWKYLGEGDVVEGHTVTAEEAAKYRTYMDYLGANTQCLRGGSFGGTGMKKVPGQNWGAALTKNSPNLTDNSTTAYMRCRTGYYTWKHYDMWEFSTGSSAYCTADKPIFKIEEVLLNYAEAKAELGSLSPDDLNITVNEIRSRVGMPALTMRDLDKQPDWYLSSEEYGYPNVTGSNEIVNAILEIRRERTVELIQEGFRLQDLYRWKAGYCIDQAISGMYFPGPGEYKLAGKETADLILYKAGETKPQAGEGVSVYELGSDIILSEGDKGYVYYHKTVENLRTPFNEERDYLYPIPSGERSLNPNLTQNPGWSDGLDF